MYSYREEKGSVSSDSSDDEEKDVLQKQPPPKTNAATEETLPNASVQSMEDDGAPKRAPKRKVNPIWAAVMSENLLSENLGQFELKLKHFKSDRSVENYDYNWKNRFSVKKPEIMKIFTGSNSAEGGVGQEISRNRRRSCEKDKKKIVFSVEKEEAFKVARVIAAKLDEPNQKLIYRTVRVLGTKVALETTNTVEEIEKNGGMKVLDGSRRRTPGGIYLYLLKNNPNIERHFKHYIFNDSLADHRSKLNKSLKKMHKKQKSKRKSWKNSSQVDQSADTDLKPLPTKLELLVSNENSEESLPASEEGETPNTSYTSRSSSSASDNKGEDVKPRASETFNMDEEVEEGEILD